MEKLVFVGCGVGTVFSVLELLDKGFPSKDIIIIEKGKSMKERKSHEIMEGFFGAGGFSDAKIVYSLDQGGELKKYVGEEKGKELINRVKDWIMRIHPKPNTIKMSKISEVPEFIRKSPFILKKFEVWHLGTNYIQEIGLYLEEYLLSKGVTIMFNTKVADINFDNNTIIGEHMNLIETFDKCIIAPGKSGIDLVDKLIKKYNLQTEPKAAQIGVRLESEYKYFKELGDVAYDFKLEKKYDNNITARTFCVCSGSAYVCAEKTYNDMLSWNGHSYRDKSKYNGKINFGIMLEINNIPDPFQHTLDLVRKCNKDAVAKTFSPLQKVNRVNISYKEFVDIYGKYCDIIMDFIKQLNHIFEFGSDYKLYIPEIKFLVNEVVVRRLDLSLIKYPNIHIIGDALSSRGLFVAMGQGLHIADTIRKTTDIVTSDVTSDGDAVRSIS